MFNFFKKIFFVIIFCCIFSGSNILALTTAVSPNISILDASSIKNTQAVLNAKIENLNGLEYVEWWFEYGVSENNMLYKTPVVKETSVKTVSYTLNNLSQDSIYYYKFCEKNSYETSCTIKKSFKTYLTPIVSILSATNIGYGTTSGSTGYGSAVVNGKIGNQGTDSKGYGSEYWFEYGIGASMSGSKTTPKKIATTPMEVFEKIDFLTSNAEYYYKLCAKNELVSVCSDLSKFRTYSNIVPTSDSDKPVVVTLEPIQGSTPNAIKLVGAIKKMGIYRDLKYYFQYDENLNFGNTINENKSITQVGEFNYVLTTASYNKTYYYRACIDAPATNTNVAFTICGESKVFTLSDYKNTTLGAKPYEVISTTDINAKIAGIVTGFGGYDNVTAWFIFYEPSNLNSITSSYGYGETRKETDKIQISGTGRIFSTTIYDLKPGVRYSYSVCVANNSNAYCNNDRKYFYTLKNPTVEISEYSIFGEKLLIQGKASNNSDSQNKISYGWFEYSLEEKFSSPIKTAKTLLIENKLKQEVTGLTIGKTYYFKFCTNIGLGDVCSIAKKIVFEKKITQPEIELINIDKNQNNIKIYAIVKSFGGEEKVSAYLEYGITSGKFEKTNNIEITKEGDEVFAHINNIKNDTKYYYRYCAKNSLFTKCTGIKEISIVSEKIKKLIPEISDDDKVNFFVDEDFAKEKAGEIFMKTDDQENLWYINPKDSKRYLMGNKDNFYLTFEKLLTKITDTNLNKIPLFLDINYGVDTDGDGISDKLEKVIGTNYKLKDSDKDGFSDLLELKNNYNPNNKKALRLSFDNNVMKNSAGKFFITSNNNVWYIGKNKKRYYIGNTSDKILMFNVLKKIAEKIYYEDLIRIDYVDTTEIFSDISDSDYDGISDKYEIIQ